MHSGTAYLISNIVLTFFWYTAACLILESRYSKAKTVLAASFMQCALWILLEHSFTLLTSFRYLIGIGFLIAIVQLFFTDRWSFKLITCLMIIVSMVLSEIALGSMIPQDMVVSGEIFEKYGAAVYSVYLFFNMTFLSLTIAGLRAYKRRYEGLLSQREWLLFVIFPFSQCILLWCWSSSYMEFNTFVNAKYVIAAIAIALAADIALIYMIRTSASATELRIRSEMLEDQVRSQGNYYSDLASTYSDIRKMRHDIDNHIYAIKALLDNGKMELASEYIEKISERQPGALRLADCRNTVVSSYLEKKFRDITDGGIGLKTDLHLPELPGISNPDLICIYGNILDNALDACRNQQNAEITLKTEYREPYLIISCTNPSGSDLKKEKRVPQLERGIGFTILDSLADQYDGQFTAKSEDGMFYTEMILKMEQEVKNAENRGL